MLKHGKEERERREGGERKERKEGEGKEGKGGKDRGGRRFRGCWGRRRERNSERIGRGRRGGIKGRGSPNYCATGGRHQG